jgi:hypothetical protein
VTKCEVGIQYSPPQSEIEVIDQQQSCDNEAEPLNVIISSQEEAPVKEELSAVEVISEAMQQ